jgi:hypothetical protein
MKMSAFGGALIGLLYACFNSLLNIFLTQEAGGLVASPPLLGQMALTALWRIFLFTILALIGEFIAETRPLKSKQPSRLVKHPG